MKEKERKPIRPHLGQPNTRMQIKVGRALVGRAVAWAENEVGQVSPSAAVSVALMVALPILERQRQIGGQPDGAPDITLNLGGMILGQVDKSGEPDGEEDKGMLSRESLLGPQKSMAEWAAEQEDNDTDE